MGTLAGSLLILALLIYLNLSPAAGADASFQYNCGSKEKFMANSSYGANLHHLLTQLSSDGDFKYGFSDLSVGRSPDLVNAIGLCRGDQKEDACRSCLNQTIFDLQRRCSDQKEAIAWSEFCMVRYSSHEISGVVETYPSDLLYSGNVSNFDDFYRVLSALLNNLANRAAVGGPFCKFAADNTKGTDSFPRIYALAQCTPDLSPQNCSFCLAMAIGIIQSSCYGRTGCRVVCPSCTVRYETNPFFAAVDVIPQQSLPPPVEGILNNKILKIIIPVAASLLVILFIAICWIRSRFRNPRASAVMDPCEMHSLGPRRFDFRELLEATNRFSDENKIGEGGFGAVYKGTLLDGQVIAIKKLLIRPSKSDRDEGFKKEVQFTAQVQHRNLISLVGFCSERDERLLIFEFAPNGGLHHWLFDPSKCGQLDWETRRLIIIGMASGLLYLHKHSYFRTVHRDLKADNILLDENMNPKIADFGCAKLLKGNQSQANNTRIVGTRGYMAPEYAIDGQLSLRSDVFSFGVLMLEIVSGEKSSFNANLKNELLSRAWENWRNNTISEFMDPTLRNDPRRDEIARYVHIGLLCVQDFEDRPQMESVVKELEPSSVTTLPLPKPHALLVNQEGHPRTDANEFCTPQDCEIHGTA